MIRRKMPKKERELILVRDFISNESLGLRVKKIDESETPDFIIRELTKDISIELTQLIHPSLMEKEVFREKLVDTAHKLFRDKYDAGLYVLITFSNVPIKAKGAEFMRQAENIFKMVENIYLTNKDYEFKVSARDIDDGNNIFIKNLSVANDMNFENWQSFGVFIVNEIDISWVKNVINEKEKMIENYSISVDEKWLLLVSNFGFKSDTHSFHYLRQEKIQSKFDKVFLYKYREKDIVALK